jgi:hypothetical protein
VHFNLELTRPRNSCYSVNINKTCLCGHHSFPLPRISNMHVLRGGGLSPVAFSCFAHQNGIWREIERELWVLISETKRHRTCRRSSDAPMCEMSHKITFYFTFTNQYCNLIIYKSVESVCINGQWVWDPLMLRPYSSTCGICMYKWTMGVWSTHA